MRRTLLHSSSTFLLGFVKGLFIKVSVYLLVIIIGMEVAIMLLFSWLGLENWLSPVWLSVLDAVLLSVLIAIPVYFLVMKPLRSAINISQTKLNMLANAIDNAGDGIIITTRKGIIEYVNQALLSMSHYKEDDIIGKHVSVIEPDMANTSWQQAFLRDIKHYGIWQDERWSSKKGGEPYLSKSTVTPIDLIGSGAITHFVTIKHDNTKHHQLKEQLLQSQKMEAMGTLVGGIAHDFNNMLAGMTGQLYIARTKAQNNPDLLERLSKMEALSFRAADMVSQLLIFAHKGAVNKVDMPLDSFIKEAVKLASVALPENIELTFAMGDDCGLCVHADATQLQQVIMNLMNNACDAVEGIEHPKISISVESIASEDSIMDKFETVGRAYACLSIIDNGCGIEEKNMKNLKVLDPFFTTKEPGKGTGLGLAMVHGSVETHNGFINIQSSIGVGTEIHIFLPLKNSSKKRLSPKLKCIYKGHGETILFVDDNVDVREAGKDMLVQLGYKVFTATDGADAIDIYMQHSNIISAVIMDVVMPKIQGSDVALRMKKYSPNLPIILMTAYDKNKVLDEKMRSNVNGVICKPFSISELSNTLHNLLSSESRPQ